MFYFFFTLLVMAPRYEIQTESSQNLISYISRLVLLYIIICQYFK